jgi:RNA polymerase sigma-70 factor (ECF subfamily)
MMALERLSPLERAAFLLHDVFGVAFDEVGRTLDRDATAVRQLAVARPQACSGRQAALSGRPRGGRPHRPGLLRRQP